ncbi:MAG: SpoIIE family protein phosphatase [Spirochaetaceae bacterium]|nr:MAG: SpoIIE family protein phosphatase [Spirochaetaceae bacterium]
MDNRRIRTLHALFPPFPPLLLLLVFFTLAPSAGAQSFFWETPQVLISEAARFPTAVSGGGLVAVVWQEVQADPQGGGRIYLSVQSSRDAVRWQRRNRVLGPITYEDREVQLYSMAVDSSGTIYLAVAAGENKTDLYRSTDEGRSFVLLSSIEAGTASLAPTISLTDSGNILLFVTQEQGNSLFIFYSVSANGRTWSSFESLVAGGELPINFLPAHTSLDGREYVVFQAWPSGSGSERNYQLYLVSSGDGGYTWSVPTRLLLSERISGSELAPEAYSNQRPFLITHNGDLALAWERQRGAGVARICFATLQPDGTILDAEEVTAGQGAARFPRIVQNRDKTLLFWFDNRRGAEHIFFAERRGALWAETDLSDIRGSSYFAYPVEHKEQLYVFWENRIGTTSRIMFLEPDQSVNVPSVSALNFDPEKRSRQDTVQILWTLPNDPSGIAGVDYLWTQNMSEPLELELKALADTTSVQLTADQDGVWYFRVAVQDYAGNWSEPASVEFTRDTRPPDTPVIRPPEADEEGYLASNTFTLGWEPPQITADLSGYSYSLVYLGSADLEAVSVDPRLSPRAMTLATESPTYNNLDDGLWAFAVASVDEAGNISAPATALLRLNKYIPVTFISSVNAQKDPFGVLSLSIGGRGFSVGGLIDSVILDQDGEPPYDYTFPRVQGQFNVVSDRLIRDLNIVDLEEGLYAVGVVHPTRGRAFTRPTLFIESPGTVKFGDFSFVPTRTWQSVRRFAYTLSSGTLILYLILAFLAVLFAVSVRQLAGIVQEGRLLRTEVLAVLRGEVLIYKEERMKELKRRGVSLRLKFTMLVMILVLITVLMVSIPLGIFMISRQSQNLTQGLRQRIDVLMGSVAASAENSLLIQNRIELGLLPDQIGSMEEAQYLTITGTGISDTRNFDYVWASNDDQIDSKLQTGTFDQASVGAIRIKDDLSPIITELAEQVNSQARQRIGDLAAEVNELSAEARDLVRRAATDTQAQARLREIQQQISVRNSQILSELRRIGSVTGSSPDFDPQELLPFYTFYRPIVYRVPGEDIYFRGAVRMGVSTERIQNELAISTRNLIIRAGIIALIAAGLGLLGAIMMASITINPIKKLALGVAKIRDTEDKEELREHVIDVRSRDEIGDLANTVNQMTQALVKAAVAAKDLTVGKGVQKMFIPLAQDPADPQGGKGTTGGEQNENIEIFGFYEGAKGVSGDYFDYRKLTDKYYAVIKCDVAGKGVPAALIMVEVATIFSTWLRDWTLKTKGFKIDQLAYLINGMLEERGFKGRFAALTLAIVDADSGKSYFVNAGDTKLHVYRANQGKMVENKLPDAPAAGVFPSDLVEMQAGFKIVTQQLQRGDTVFLFTDGIEEAQRLFRNDSFEPITCQEPGLEEGEEHGSHTKGQEHEEFGIIRIYDLINAVFNRQIYRLVKFHNPMPEEELLFDFTDCEGTVEEAVLAMVAVEKVFRLNPDPSAAEDDHVEIDRNIDAFLKKHFKQFERYFHSAVAGDEERSSVIYGFLKEDEQYDDLTILAIRKK